MRSLPALVFLAAALTLSAAGPASVYELRIYTTHPGKMPDLLARFRDHTCAIFTRLGMVNVGYWLPVDAKDGDKLYYVLKHPSRGAAKAAWQVFSADPGWQQVRKESEANGSIVRGVESIFMEPTDYSPAALNLDAGAHVFELRTYTANEGKLDALDARFRDHTLALFARHGMTNLLYWHPLDTEKGAGRTLIYLLAHRSQDEARKSWDAFRADPEWVSVRTESEKNGSLLASGPKSVYLTPTDFSPLK